MEITFSKHAAYRMERREVSEEDVELVIRQGKGAKAKPGSQKKVLLIRDKKVGVAYRQTGSSSYHVATVTVD